MFLFGGDDDFRVPRVVLSVLASASAPAWAGAGAPLVAAWSAADHTDDSPWLALGCGATVRVVDVQARPASCSTSRTFELTTAPQGHDVALHLLPSPLDCVVGLALDGQRLAVLTAQGQLCAFSSPQDAHPRVCSVCAAHGAPAALALALGASGEMQLMQLLVIGDIEGDGEPTASLWEWSHDSATPMRCSARVGAPPTGARRRRWAATAARQASLLGDGTSDVQAPTPTTRIQPHPWQRRFAFRDASGRVRLLQAGAAGESLSLLPAPPSTGNVAPSPAADLAWWGEENILIAPADGAPPYTVSLPGLHVRDVGAAAACGAVALAALPGGRPRALCACRAVDGAAQGWRLLSLRGVSGSEALQGLLRCGDWAEALAMAAAHKLDDTPVYAARWGAEAAAGGDEDDVARVRQLTETLRGAPNRRWAVAACASFAANCDSAATVRAVLRYGLAETEAQCRGGVGAALLDPAELAGNERFFFFVRARLQLLSALERLETLGSLYGGGGGAGACFSALRDAPSLRGAATAFAAGGAARGCETLVRRHPRAMGCVPMPTVRGEAAGVQPAETPPWWRHLLDAFPPTLSPDAYAALLPWGVVSHPPGAPATDPDWAEHPAIAAALRALPDPHHASEDGLQTPAWLLQCTEGMIAAQSAAMPWAKPTASQAATWAISRVAQLDAQAGQLPHALALARRAMEGLPGMCVGGEDVGPALRELRRLKDAGEELFEALCVPVAADEQRACTGAWEHARIGDVAALSEGERLRVLLSGATATSSYDRVTRLAARLRARLGGPAAAQLTSAWAEERAREGGIEPVAALFSALQQRDELAGMFSSEQAGVACGLACLFACGRTESSALDAAAELALSLPRSTGAGGVVAAARSLAAHGAAPSLERVRRAAAEPQAARALLGSLAARFARRQPPPADAAWSALWRDMSELQAGALGCLSVQDVLLLFLEQGLLPAGAWHLARKYLSGTPSAPLARDLAERAVMRAAHERLRCAALPHLDAALEDASDALALLLPECARAAADMDAIAAFRTLPELGVHDVMPSALLGDRSLLLRAALDAKRDAWREAGPLLALARRLGLNSQLERCSVELMIAQRAVQDVCDEPVDATSPPPPPLARDMCIALARRGFAPAASLAARVGLCAGVPADAARELLSFALCATADASALPGLLDAWAGLQGCEDAEEEESTTGGGSAGRLPLSAAAAAAFICWRGGGAPDDDTCYMLCHEAMACPEGVQEPGVLLALLLAPTAAPVAATAAAGSRAALRLAATAHGLRCAAAVGALDARALGAPLDDTLRALDARGPALPPHAAASLAAAKALLSQADAAADAAALARLMPNLVNADAFASGDAAHRARILLAVAAAPEERQAALDAALVMAAGCGVRPFLLLWARAEALLLLADDATCADALDAVATQLVREASDAAEAAESAASLFAKLPDDCSPARCAAYFRMLARLLGAVDEATAARCARVECALRLLPADCGVYPKLLTCARGGPPAGGAPPALAAIARCQDARTAAAVAEAVAALPCPPQGLTPSAGLAAAALAALLRHLGDPSAGWSAASELLRSPQVSGPHAAAVVTAALATPGAQPLEQLIAHAASTSASPQRAGGTTRTPHEQVLGVAAGAPRRLRLDMLCTALQLARTRAAPDHCVTPLAHALRRANAAAAAAAAWSGWRADELASLEAIADDSDDSGDAAAAETEQDVQLRALLSSCALRGAPFRALLASACAVSRALAHDALARGCASALSQALAALLARQGGGALQSVLACLADEQQAESATAPDATQSAPSAAHALLLDSARHSAHGELMRFAGDGASSTAHARVVALEALEALQGGFTWRGWAPPHPPSPPQQQQKQQQAEKEIEVVVATGDAMEACVCPSPPEAAPPAEPPAVLPPSAPAFDAALSLLAARTGAALEGLLPAGGAGCVKPSDVVDPRAAAALFHAALAAASAAPSSSAAGDAAWGPAAALALWERSAPWARPSLCGAGAGGEGARPLHALWMALLAAGAPRRQAALDAAEAAVAGHPQAPLLTQSEALQLLAAAAGWDAVEAAAVVACLCPWPAAHEAAVDALTAACAAASGDASVRLSLRCATLLVATGALPLLAADVARLPLLGALCASLAEAQAADDSQRERVGAAQALMCHTCAALTTVGRVAEASAVALKATRTHPRLVSLDGGEAVLKRLLAAHATRFRGERGRQGWPGAAGGSTRAVLALREALPEACADASAALTKTLRDT